MPNKLLCSAFLLVMLSACGKPETPVAPAAPVAAAVPADPKLAKLFEQTCKSCHGTGAGGAPLAGDRAAWAPRVAQGMPALLEHTLNGFKGMPPLGSCSDCSQQEFEALIRFMSGQEGGQ